MKYLILCLSLLGCNSGENYSQPYLQYETNAAKQLMREEMFYVKDHSTNLCFAVVRPYWNSAMFTNVPCTKEVEEKLK